MHETSVITQNLLENREKEIARRRTENAEYIDSNQKLRENIRAKNTIAENATLTSTIFLCLIAPGILCGLILPPVMLVIPAILCFIALISSVVAQIALADKETFDTRIIANNQGVESNNRHIESLESSAKRLREQMEKPVEGDEPTTQNKRPASTTPGSLVQKFGTFQHSPEHQNDRKYDSAKRPRSLSCS